MNVPLRKIHLVVVVVIITIIASVFSIGVVVIIASVYGLPTEALLVAEKVSKDRLTNKHAEVRDWKVSKVTKPELSPADVANDITDRRHVIFTFLYRDDFPNDPWTEGEFMVALKLTRGKWVVESAIDTSFGRAMTKAFRL